MSFNILYNEDGDWSANLASIAIYVNDFAKNLGLKELRVDSQGFTQVASALIHPSFPHVDGLQKASPFKKAANFFVWFVASKPILEELPGELIGPHLKSIPNHQNTIFAYHMAVDCLHGAKIHRDGDIMVLKKKITVSMHFFTDFVEAYSSAVPAYHFKMVSLLFEQLAYKANPGASYDEIV